jgi:hypothetical protein
MLYQFMYLYMGNSFDPLISHVQVVVSPNTFQTMDGIQEYTGSLA